MNCLEEEFGLNSIFEEIIHSEQKSQTQKQIIQRLKADVVAAEEDAAKTETSISQLLFEIESAHIEENELKIQINLQRIKNHSIEENLTKLKEEVEELKLNSTSDQQRYDSNLNEFIMKLETFIQLNPIDSIFSISHKESTSTPVNKSAADIEKMKNEIRIRRLEIERLEKEKEKLENFTKTNEQYLRRMDYFQYLKQEVKADREKPIVTRKHEAFNKVLGAAVQTKIPEIYSQNQRSILKKKSFTFKPYK